MALQHLRSSTADKRPTPAAMADGQLAVNTAGASPGLFFKDASGNLIKVGPVHVGTTAPNASPASGGQTGNTVGEQWLDTSSSKYVFKIWDGTAWRSEAGEFVDAAGDVMTGALGIIGGTAGAPGLYVSGDTNTGVFSPGADQLAVSTGGTARLTVDSTGKVLAGTSTALTNAYAIGSALSPALQVESNTANGAAVSITRHTSAAANLLLQRGVTGTPVADTEAVGQIGFNGFDGTSYYNAALIRGVVDGTPGTGSMPGRLSFQTTPSGSTTPVERLRLDPAGQILAASLGTAAAPVWSFTDDTNTGIFSPSADAFAVSTGGTERARIDSSGRLLVGTNSIGSNAASSVAAIKGSNVLLGTGQGQLAVITTNTQAADVGGSILLGGQSTQADWPYACISGRSENNGYAGYFAVGTSNAAGSVFERLRIASTGQVRLAGAGITFNGDTATANELDDYEEGTFTPAVTGTTVAGTATYTTQVGSYTKTGRLVQAQLYVTYSGHTGTGNLTITGLPFTSQNRTSDIATAAVQHANLALTAGNVATAYVNQNATSIRLDQVPTGGGAANAVPMDAAATIGITVVYTV